MPTVLNIEGYKFKFYSNENDEPPHIHITKGEGNAKYWLYPEVEETYSYGFTVQEQRRIKTLVRQNSEQCVKQFGLGMSTSDKITNKPSTDPFDQLIFERGLRAKHLLFDKELDLLLVVLNNAKILKLPLSDYPRLYNASEQQLNNWKFIGGGVAIEWEELDEDLSVKGFIKKVAIKAITGSAEDDIHKVVA